MDKKEAREYFTKHFTELLQDMQDKGYLVQSEITFRLLPYEVEGEKPKNIKPKKVKTK